MRNKDKYAVAVRKPDKSIDVDIQECGGIAKKYKITTLPFIRGIFSFIDSMVIGIKTLTYSASFFEDEQEEEPGKFEKWLLNKFGEKAEKIVMGIYSVSFNCYCSCTFYDFTIIYCRCY